MADEVLTEGPLALSDKRLCVIILENVVAPDGQYIPCIAVEDEQGYCRTDWKWGTDRDTAYRLAEQYNQRLGLTAQDVVHIQLSTMRH